MIAPEDLRSEAVLCLRAGPPQWAPVAAKLSEEIRWLCLHSTDPSRLRDRVAADFAERYVQSETDKVAWTALWPVVHAVFEILLDQHMGYRRWLARRDAHIMLMFPVDEVIEIRGGGPSGWREKWAALGGRIHAERCFAKKGDPIWARFSEFGLAYEPFDWTGNLVVADVTVENAEKLGVI